MTSARGPVQISWFIKDVLETLFCCVIINTISYKVGQNLPDTVSLYYKYYGTSSKKG